MAGFLFVIGQRFPEHWPAALQAGFWETERHFEVGPGDSLIFWQAGRKQLLGVGRATHAVEPADYQHNARPWSPEDTTTYRHRYRFVPTVVDMTDRIQWSALMEVLELNPRRGANTAPMRFERSADEVLADLEHRAAIGSLSVETGIRRHRVRPSAPGNAIGEYRSADEAVASKEGQIFERDPREFDRGLRGHAGTQNALARWLRGQQIMPRGPGSVNVDIAWLVNDETYVAEVKSLTTTNEVNQLRLGLGEVLEFSFRLGGARPVLAVERMPSDPTWNAICDEAGVRLVWPGAFERLLPWHA